MVSKADALIIFALVGAAGCGQAEPGALPSPALEAIEAEEIQLRDEAIVTLTGMIQEVQSRVAGIARAQRVVSNTLHDGENLDRAQREAIFSDLDALDRELASQRSRIAELTNKLEVTATSSLTDRRIISNLRGLIETLEEQTDEQRTTIEGLTGRLAQVEADLSKALDQVANQSEEISTQRSALAAATRQIEDFSITYYIVAEPKRLRDLQITCRGIVLDRTSLCDIKREFMTPGSVALGEIALGPAVKGARVFTLQASRPDLYEIVIGDMSFFRIRDPDAFWRIQPDLVIEIKR